MGASPAEQSKTRAQAREGKYEAVAQKVVDTPKSNRRHLCTVPEHGKEHAADGRPLQSRADRIGGPAAPTWRQRRSRCAVAANELAAALQRCGTLGGTVRCG